MEPWWQRHALRAKEGDDGGAGDGAGGGGDGASDGGGEGGARGDGGGPGLFGDVAGDGGHGEGRPGDQGAHPAAGQGSDDGTPPKGQAADGDDAAKRPEYVPEAFWDEEKGEPRLEQAFKALKDTKAELTRSQQSGKLDKDAPKSADEYLADWTLPEGDDAPKLDRIGPIEKDDFALKVFADIAQKNGFSKARFNATVVDFLAAVNEHMPEPVNLDAEREKLGGGEKAKQVISAAQAWVQSLSPRKDDGDTGRQSALTDGEARALSQLANTAEGINALMKLREMSGEAPIPRTGTVDPGGVKTAEECYAMMDDPRYSKQGPEGDRYRAQVDAEFARTFGTGRGSFSGRVLPRDLHGNA